MAISFRYKTIIKSINALGIGTVEVPSYNNITDNYESSHADMQALRIENTLFLLKNNDKFNNLVAANSNLNIIYTENTIDRFVYPDCVKLNAAVVNKKIIANKKYIDKSITKCFPEYDIIHVKQGYAKCSCAIISNKAVITSDESIYNACVLNKTDCLKISPGHIQLCEKYGGFIGGSCFQIGDTVLFTGKIENHPDFLKIKAFCQNYSVKIMSLTDAPLTDVGGVVIMSM